jgi:hypothetical protein
MRSVQKVSWTHCFSKPVTTVRHGLDSTLVTGSGYNTDIGTRTSGHEPPRQVSARTSRCMQVLVVTQCNSSARHCQLS